MIDRTPVSQAAARQLQQMIRDGELHVGERLLSQRVMSGRMGYRAPRCAKR